MWIVAVLPQSSERCEANRFHSIQQQAHQRLQFAEATSVAGNAVCRSWIRSRRYQCQYDYHYFAISSIMRLRLRLEHSIAHYSIKAGFQIK
ncbi:hypothetical protein RB195_017997 [Necator americanus]|uniref:Uncharacterized protein n=1 Tax=Necator americanus TaxID=51031 RepID=A0ABR1C7R8_NECAM